MHEYLISIGILSITSRDILPIRYGILPLNTTIFPFSIRYLNSYISIMMSSRVNLNSIILNAVCKLCILILIKHISMVEVSLNVLDYPDVCWKYNWYILFPMKKGILMLQSLYWREHHKRHKTQQELQQLKNEKHNAMLHRLSQESNSFEKRW
jgi:hypothetical protein